MMGIKRKSACAIFVFTLAASNCTIASKNSPHEIVSRINSTSEKTIKLSRNSATRDEAISALGHPDYVILPKNFKQMSYDGSPGLAYALLWDNAPCTANELWFNKNDRVIGADASGGGNATISNIDTQCSEFRLSIERDKLKKFSCKTPTRPAYCAPSGNPINPSLSREERRKKFETQFSSWDGSNKILEKEIKSTMHNPSSYKHLESQHRYENNNVIVKTIFTGTNAFGGVVKSTVFATIDIKGKILSMEMQQE